MTHKGPMYRPDDPETSIEAAESVDTTALEALVLGVVAKYPGGCIQDDILGHFPWRPYSSITARFASLSRKGHIVYTGERRPGRSGRNQRVMKLHTGAEQ